MEKAFPEIKEHVLNPRIIEEAAYVEKCVSYVKSIGWVHEQDYEKYVEIFFRPIHEEYMRIMGEMQQELDAANINQSEFDAAVLRLNNCLDATRRIGSTDPENVLKTIEDVIKTAYRGGDYCVYAVEAIHEFVRNLLYK